MPSYDDIKKFCRDTARTWKNKKTRWRVILYMGPIVVITGWYLWSDYSARESLAARVAYLTRELKTAEREIESVRQAKLELLSENNRLKLLLDPIQRKARELYPELENAAAVAKLAKDIEDVRTVLSRGTFRPLNDEVSDAFVASLVEVKRLYPHLNRLNVWINAGNRDRELFGSQLARLIRLSGFHSDAKIETLKSPAPPGPSLEVQYNPANDRVLQALRYPFFIFQQSSINVGLIETMETNTVNLLLYGEPEFQESGVVYFR